MGYFQDEYITCTRRDYNDSRIYRFDYIFMKDFFEKQYEYISQKMCIKSSIDILKCEVTFGYIFDGKHEASIDKAIVIKYKDEANNIYTLESGFEKNQGYIERMKSFLKCLYKMLEIDIKKEEAFYINEDDINKITDSKKCVEILMKCEQVLVSIMEDERFNHNYMDFGYEDDELNQIENKNFIEAINQRVLTKSGYKK